MKKFRFPFPSGVNGTKGVVLCTESKCAIVFFERLSLDNVLLLAIGPQSLQQNLMFLSVSSNYHTGVKVVPLYFHLQKVAVFAPSCSQRWGRYFKKVTSY